MDEDFVAETSVAIQAEPARVWNALVDRQSIKEYMFGADVESDWRQGSPIVWKGEWKGKKFEDRGVVLDAEPGRRLRYTHISTAADGGQQQHVVSIRLLGDGGQTAVSLRQSNNPTAEAKASAEKNWQAMLEGMKKLVESSPLNAPA